MSDNNNLRDETGALIGGLVVLDYNAGIEDYEAGKPPPDALTSPSYDLGRQRAAERRATAASVKAWLKRDEEQRDARMRELLTPEDYAEYRKKIDAISPADPLKGGR